MMMNFIFPFLIKVYEKEEIIPENLLAYITFCVVTALEYLHKDLHVIHRDVKPSNILVDRLGRVKVGLVFHTLTLPYCLILYDTNSATATALSRISHLLEGFALANPVALTSKPHCLRLHPGSPPLTI
ncbi:unnamed protein product [Dibothriocephalus latus]|uniref:mitogen-activated protein kinase kinase n=1 Tax=Dibothriocephalus latus TaxID=60516 RepID=A0A3P7PDU0_DIBLA|nr:unnamed protein product [Dibothriocephalus latus]